MLVLRSELSVCLDSIDAGPASLRAGPRCREGIARRGHVRQPVEYSIEHRVVRHWRAAAHARGRSAAR